MGRARKFDFEQALELATRQFWEKGYAGTSLDDLTAAMGIARPSLYRAFGNKEALFKRSVEYFERKYLGFVDEALRKRKFRAAIQSLLEGTIRVCTGTSTPTGSLLTHGAPASPPEDETVRLLLASRITAYEQKLLKRLDLAAAEAELPADISHAGLAAFVITHCCGIALRAKGGVPLSALMAELPFVMAAIPEPGGS
jgi:AcrR family transcriptional regulator